MQDVPNLSPLLQYDLLPAWIALALVMFIGLVYGLILWSTRRRPQKVLGTLPPAQAVVVDITHLKERYLAEIDTVEKAYRSRELKARIVHQELSRILKTFVSEAECMPVKTMTLSDLKKTRHAKLASAIESYYRPEFAAVESGSVDESLATARKVVSEWP